MNRIVRNAVLSAAVAATTLSAAPMAEAGDRWRHHDRRVVVQQRDDTGALVAAGILGLAVGAIAAGVVAQPPQPVYERPYRYSRPRYEPDYYPPAPRYRDYDYDAYAGAYEPWSPEWYRYCSQRYRSFDPSTGTYFIRPGVERFCVVE